MPELQGAVSDGVITMNIKTIIVSIVIVLTIITVAWITGGIVDKLLAVQPETGKILVDAESGKNVVALVSSTGWLFIILIALLALFQPISVFLEGISSRITKVSAFDISIEVAQLSEYTPTWSKVVDNDIRKITPPYVFDSYSQTLFNEITEKSPADYAVIDLGEGREWLTSRLYLFTIMLERMRGLKAFVFVASVDGCSKCYVGTAITSHLRWAHARQYNWLEKSFADAYSQTINQFHPSSTFLEQGKIDENTARTLGQNFLLRIQQSIEPAGEKHEWITIDKPLKLWEHAQWIDVALLKKILKGSLYTESLVYSAIDTPHRQAKNVAALDEPLIAFTNSKGVFHSLVDRQELLRQIALKSLASIPDEQDKKS